MYIPYSMNGYQGFGLAVPTPLPSEPWRVSNITPTGYNYCGSKYGMQQMLKDLGYYAGAVDGKVGQGTTGAMTDFANINGVTSGSDAFCQKLMDVWSSQMQPGSTPPKQEKKLIQLRPELFKIKMAALTPTTGGASSGGAMTAPPAADQGVIDKAKAWWNDQSTGTKVAVGVGAAAVVGLVLYAIFGGESAPAPASAYTANRRAPAKRSRSKLIRAVKSRARATKRSKGSFPKKYYSMGARRAKDYADPEGRRYPLVFRTKTGKIKRAATVKHIQSAKGYFTKHKSKYPPALRRKIARNINAANKRFHVGGKAVKP